MFASATQCDHNNFSLTYNGWNRNEAKEGLCKWCGEA